eukprot:2641916-Prymnesium_polylepis.1
MRENGGSLPDGANMGAYPDRGWESQRERFTHTRNLCALCLVICVCTLCDGGPMFPCSSQCFCESRWAMLTKDFDYALDLGKLTETEQDLKAIIKVCTKGGGRKAPMVPSDFVEELKAKSFTNGKEDRPM